MSEREEIRRQLGPVTEGEDNLPALDSYEVIQDAIRIHDLMSEEENEK